MSCDRGVCLGGQVKRDTDGIRAGGRHRQPRGQ